MLFQMRIINYQWNFIISESFFINDYQTGSSRQESLSL